MCPVCTVCTHKDRKKIDEMILQGVSLRNISKQFNLNYQSINRHKKNHLTEALLEGHKAEAVTHADTLLMDLQGTKETALWFLNEAKEAKDLKAAAPLISSACRVIELLAEVRGQIDRKAEINIIMNPEFIQFKQNILSVVNSCPECKKRLLEALK